MSHDSYGRPQRGDRINGEFDYFENNDPTHLQYMSHRPSSTEPRRQHSESSNAHLQSSPSGEKMTATSTNRTDAGQGLDAVSPELIAVITEQVKRQVMEQLKTGPSDDFQKAPSMQRELSNTSKSSASPSQTARAVYTPPSPMQLPKFPNTAQAPMESARSPPASPLDKPSGVRFSDRGPPRPAGARTWSTMELSTIDQKWGRLFDAEGNPTQRLGQFLRGLANHLIDEFAPNKSLVVTPAKMARYYSLYPVEKEAHPLITIFKAQSNEQISQLYQDLGCRHHLVQDHETMTPTVPSLTPIGFAHWMTINLLAYPEQEYRRLEQVVLALPIDADGEMIDGKPERLPKQISRHLLPEGEDRKSKKLLDNAIEGFFEDLGTTQRRKASLPNRLPSQSPPRATRNSPPLSRQSSTSASRRDSYRPPVEIHQARTPPTFSKSSQPIERERNPYGGAPSNSENSSNEEHNVKIERDRQPYSAQPGNGRVYENPAASNGHSGRADSRSRTREAEHSEPRQARTHSNASKDSYNPPPRAGRRTSSPQKAGGRRTSSPPMKNFSHSTPADIDSGSRYPPASSSSSFNTGNTFNPNTGPFPPPPPIDIRGDRGSRDRYGRRTTAASLEDAAGLTSEFSSPRDAERWDRYQDSQSARGDFERPYERSSVSGAPVEEWYREKGRGSGHDDVRRYA